MKTVVLQSGKSVRQTVDEFVQEMMKLPEKNEKEALGAVVTLIAFERIWKDKNNYQLSDQYKDAIKDGLVADAVSGLTFDKLPMVVETKAKISPYLAVWLNAVTENVRWYSQMLGTIAYYFYETHSRDQYVTLEWVHDFIGANRDFPSVFGFRLVRALTVADADPHTYAFNVITEKEFYSYEAE